MAQKNDSFGDNPFGRLFDFNHDGKESLFEQALAFKMIENCQKTAADITRPDYHYSYTEANSYAWRDTCENGQMYNIYPSDFETEEEYNYALQEAKYAWRATCEDGSDYEIDPEDYETEDEYNDALEDAQEIAESSGTTVNFSFSLGR